MEEVWRGGEYPDSVNKHDNKSENSAKSNIEEKENERLCSVICNTIVNPWTMVIKSANTSIHIGI